MKRRGIIEHVSETILPALLNSYAVIFFFNNRLFSVVLLIVTFFNPVAGISGLISATAAVIIADRMGFDKTFLRQGIYSFNALLAGIGLGTLFEPGPVFFAFLLLASVVSLIISVTLSGIFSRQGLPFLSIPFVLTLWIFMIPAAQLTNIGLTQRNIFWMNELYSVGGKSLVDIFQVIDNLPLNKFFVIYLRSLSSIIFQDNLVAGIIIAAAILYTSRITFFLSLLGFFAAYLFAFFIGADIASFSFYNIGANYILLAIAVGGFFLIPSKYSFLWSVLLIPVLSMFILFLRRLTGDTDLALFSLPFSLITITFVYFLKLRIVPGPMKCTFIQHYSPEINLYTFINSTDRLSGFRNVQLFLPFWGEWTINQGYDGEHTHKGEWKNALDFVISDETGKLFSGNSLSNDNYYCFDKPVLAPCDGIVSEIADNVPDNEPGKVDTGKNWGNTIVIKHGEYIYTQLSHLKRGSFRKKKGDFVRKGEIIASCGNSGRSPESHLHFQVQQSPAVGSVTIEYPFAYYLKEENDRSVLCTSSIPVLNEKVSNLSADPLLSSAFDHQPGMRFGFSWSDDKSQSGSVKWEIATDAYNNRYIFCRDTDSYAYFVNDGIMFYFTAFYGDHNSLLFHFYLAFYKVLLGYYSDIEINDKYPLHIIKSSSISLWIHDFIAPFHKFLEMKYRNRVVWSDSSMKPGALKLEVIISRMLFGTTKTLGSGTITVADNKIKEFRIEYSGRKIWAENSNL